MVYVSPRYVNRSLRGGSNRAAQRCQGAREHFAAERSGAVAGRRGLERIEPRHLGRHRCRDAGRCAVSALGIRTVQAAALGRLIDHGLQSMTRVSNP